MPRPPQAQALRELRQQRVAADAALQQAIADVETAQRQRDAARLQPGADLASAEAAMAAQGAAYLKVRQQRNDLLAQTAAQSAAAAQAGNDAANAKLYEGLEGDQPIVLLPVRLETRYGRNRQGQPISLKVRIYPDELQVQRHVAALTAAEQDAAQHYWQARFAAQPPRRVDEDDAAWAQRSQRAAALWGEMVRALRAPRAAFVVQRLRPDNADWLEAPAAAGVAPPEPAFPDVGAPGARLAAQPVAVMLPDRFCAVGLVGEQVVFARFGEPVPDVLAAAPVIHPGDADGATDPPDANAPPVDPFAGEAQWLADYDSAVKLGMAISVSQVQVDAWRAAHPGTPAFAINQTLDQLVVIGVDWTLTPDEAAAGLGALFESHAASGGLSFLPLGTPTNNTGETSSGHSPADERDPATPQPLPPRPSDAAQPGPSAIDGLRFALGLDDATLGATPLPHQALNDGDTARHMLNALYRALAGNFLEEFWADANAKPAQQQLRAQALDALRDHATTYLRPAGPLQPLRVGKQPYGLLPVLAPAAYAADDSFEAGMKRVLDLLRPSWTGVQHKSAQFDGQAATTHGLLRHGPWAQSISYREVERDAIGQNAKEEIERLQQQQRFHPASLFVQALGATWGAGHAQVTSLAALQVAAITFKPQPSKLPSSMAWVQADADLPQHEAAAQAQLSPNYLSAIANSINPAHDPKQVIAGLRNAKSLLQGLMAYSAELEMDAANRRVLGQLPSADGRGIAALAQSPRLLHIAPPEPTAALTAVAHVGEAARLVLPGITGAETLGRYTARAASALVDNGMGQLPRWSDEPRRNLIEAVRRLPQRDLRHLASVKASLLALQSCSVGELNWALRSTLAVFDDRLDAWYTSLATRRLARLRVRNDANGQPQRRTGAHVGAWGFVEKLRPDGPGNRESLGHVLAPSLRHAAAAAVLRSGYLANDAQARKTFTLDLSSRRVRAAREIFEGLAQGQPLAALIGYQFERGLRNALLAQHILAFRRKYPMRRPPASQPAPSAAEESISARDVTDGVQLLADGAAAANLLPPGAARMKVSALLARLAQLWDAAADVAVTESVYQVTQGNMERAAAALSVLDKQAMPVEPQSVLSPRDGVRYTQRVALLMDATAGPPDGWPQDAASRAEPVLNAWLAELIGPPERFVLSGRAITAQQVLQPLSLNPMQLGLSPLALMLALDAPGSARADAKLGGVPAAPPPDAVDDALANSLQELSRLRLVLVEQLFAQAAQQLPGQAVRLQVDEQSADGPGLVQLEALLGLARRLVSQARPALQRDLAVVEGRFDAAAPEGDYPGVDAAQLDQRAQNAVAELRAVHDWLKEAQRLADADEADGALRAARLFKLPATLDDGRVPASAAEAAAAKLARAGTAQLAAASLLAQVDDMRAEVSPASTPGQLAPIAVDTLKAVFGRGFTVLPVFAMGAAASDVQACLSAQPMLNQGRPEAVVGWLPKVAKVRAGVEQLQSLLLARELLVAPWPTARFQVLQSTGRVGGQSAKAPWQQPWVALPEAWPQKPDGAAESQLLGLAHQRPDLAVAVLLPEVIASGEQPVVADTPLAGLVCDDWAETVPLHSVTAAVAFHYDAPGARPPQSVLVAVPPASNMANWSFNMVLATVREAMALSRLRLVQPAELEGAVNLALPLNLVPDSKAPDFAGLQIKTLVELSQKSYAAMAGSKVLADGKY